MIQLSVSVKKRIIVYVRDCTNRERGIDFAMKIKAFFSCINF